MQRKVVRVVKFTNEEKEELEFLSNNYFDLPEDIPLYLDFESEDDDYDPILDCKSYGTIFNDYKRELAEKYEVDLSMASDMIDDQKRIIGFIEYAYI